MKTRLATLASAALLGALAGASGCVDNRASISMQAICIPTDDCTFASTCEANLIGYPAYDIAVDPGALVLFVQVANQLPNNEDLTVGRLNTNDAHVDEIVTELEGAASGTVSIGANDYIPASGSAVVAVVIPISTSVTGEALARVRLRGYYDHGGRFETGEFTVSFGICSGCTTSCTTAACPQNGQAPVTCAEATATP